MARSRRPGTDPDDWFSDVEQPPARREARHETPDQSEEAPYAREEEGDDWLTGEDAYARSGAGSGLLHTLSEWRLVVGIVALAALLLAGLAIGGVFDSSPGATGTTTAQTTTRHTTTAKTTTGQTTTTGTAPAVTSGPTTTLKPSDTGAEVTKLQQALNSLGYSVGTPDGVYGPSTTAALASFQTAKKLTADGVLGPTTLAALTSALQGP